MTYSSMPVLSTMYTLGTAHDATKSRKRRRRSSTCVGVGTPGRVAARTAGCDATAACGGSGGGEKSSFAAAAAAGGGLPARSGDTGACRRAGDCLRHGGDPFRLRGGERWRAAFRPVT